MMLAGFSFALCASASPALFAQEASAPATEVAPQEAQQNSQLLFNNAWARAAKKGHNSAIYGTLDNPTDQEIRVIGASAPGVKTVELHTVITEEKEGQQVHEMRPVPYFSVMPGKTTELKKGGFHIMLIDLTQDLKNGEQTNVTLDLSDANGYSLGTIEVPVNVKKCCGGCHHKNKKHTKKDRNGKGSKRKKAAQPAPVEQPAPAEQPAEATSDAS